jgi:hypothetical protein
MIKNQKTALFTIAAVAAVLAVSTIAIGNGRMALAADTTTTTITKDVNNTGVNVQTDTNQKQDCLTAGANSGIANSCTASSTDNINQQGGILKK